MQELIQFWHTIQPVIHDNLLVVFLAGLFVLGIFSFALKNTK